MLTEHKSSPIKESLYANAPFTWIERDESDDHGWVSSFNFKTCFTIESILKKYRFRLGYSPFRIDTIDMNRKFATMTCCFIEKN